MSHAHRARLGPEQAAEQRRAGGGVERDGADEAGEAGDVAAGDEAAARVARHARKVGEAHRVAEDVGGERAGDGAGAQEEVAQDALVAALAAKLAEEAV